MALTPTLSPTPHVALPDPGPAAPLEERIQAAEARLVQREQDLVLRWREMRSRIGQSLSPRRWVVPAALGVVAALGLWWLVSRSAPAAPSRPAMPGRERARTALRTRPLWLRALVLLWPMLPAPWRGHLSPATTAAVMTLGLPLADRLFGDDTHSADAPLQTMPHVDLHRYAGTWHEIARLPMLFEAACEGQPSATYEPLPSGALRVLNRCRGHGGAQREVEGVASVVPRSGNAKLEVSLWPQWLRWLPLAWAPYWILFVDADYEVAVVGHPNRRFLWLLSRRPTLPAAQVATLVHIAASQGYPVDRLRFAASR